MMCGPFEIHWSYRYNQFLQLLKLMYYYIIHIYQFGLELLRPTKSTRKCFVEFKNQIYCR